MKYEKIKRDIDGWELRSCSHHHESCSTFLNIARAIVARSKVVLARGRSLLTVPFAELSSANLIVVGTERDSARKTCEASGMELLACVCLQILAFNTIVTGSAERSIELVVMMLAIRCVLKDVEFRGWEAVAACSANETRPVVAPD